MKKTVAINTFSFNRNAGTMLQEYALYNYLKKLGFKPIIIKYDCPPTYQWPYYYQLTNKHLYIHPRAFLNNHMFFKLLRELKFILFRSRMKHSCKFRQTTKKRFAFDYLICGSDQILNQDIVGPNQDIYINGGDVIQAKINKIIYAGSFGRKGVNDSNIIFFKTNFLKTDYISFREDTYTKTFSDLCGKKIIHTCDPTLLVEKDFWLNRIKKRPPYKKKYIFLYYATKELLAKAQIYAEKYNTMILFAFNKFEEIPKDKRFVWVYDDPISFINYIYYAEYIFTISFHCCVFSLIFNKRFYCPINEDKKFIRIKNLLSYLPGYNTNSINDSDEPIDYQYYNKIKDIRNVSKDFLRKALNLNENR